MSRTDIPKSGLAKQENDDKNNGGDEDWISQLPDHILLEILSRLTLKEEAIMCGISKRWRPLWSYIYAMNFDASYAMTFEASKIFYDVSVKEQKQLLNEKRYWYVNWVDQILRSHKGSTIDEFRIHFDFDCRFAHEIDGWLDFAISHRVQKLEFNLAPAIVNKRNASRCYTFSKDLYDRLKTPPGLSCIKSLNTLCLRHVNVTGEILEHFLSSCPALERLVVDGCEVLESIKVVASSSPLRLKRLEILSCDQFKEIDISAPNLVSFRYRGREIRINIGLSPFMVDLFLQGMRNHSPVFAFPQLSSYFCRLETLELSFHTESKEFPNISELTKLKHLTITTFAESHESMLGIDPLIRASPCLHKLTLKMFTCKGCARRRVRKKVLETTHQYQSLKMVEVIGFAGSRIEFEILFFIVGKAIMLEKVVIDRRELFSFGKPWEFEEWRDKLQKCMLCI